jgi:hypothetical protein
MTVAGREEGVISRWAVTTVDQFLTLDKAR